MTQQSNSEQTIGNLTRGQLEEIIRNIVQNIFKQEMKIAQDNESQVLTATFGTWEDEKTAEEIIQEIYESRNSHLTSI